MSDIVERAQYCREWGNFDDLHGELLAEVERLHSWDGLMSLLNEHYPEDIFPTMQDREDRDPGPRIVSLIRTLGQLRTQLDAFATESVTHGDMTPAAARGLRRILEGER